MAQHALIHQDGVVEGRDRERERITLLKMTAPARTEEKGDISGPADCAQRTDVGG